MYPLDTCPLSRVTYTSYTKLNDDLQSPFVIGAHTQNTPRYPHYIVALTSYKPTTLDSVGLKCPQHPQDTLAS